MDEEIVIYATKYLGKLAKLVQDTDKRVLANYILMRFIRHRINNLDKRYTSQPSGSVFNTFRFLWLFKQAFTAWLQLRRSDERSPALTH